MTQIRVQHLTQDGWQDWEQTKKYRDTPSNKLSELPTCSLPFTQFIYIRPVRPNEDGIIFEENNYLS